MVHQSQAGCIIGKGGSKIKEIREVSLRILFKICTKTFLLQYLWLRAANKPILIRNIFRQNTQITSETICIISRE